MFIIKNVYENTDPNKKVTASLGGAGITLVGLLHLEKVSPGFNDPEILKGLGNFILYCQKENGGFRSKYILGKGFDEKLESLYYPGEAAFGLTLLYEYTKEKVYLESAYKAI